MLTTGEAARLLGVTAQTVINWIDAGKLSAVRVGRGRRKVLEASLRILVDRSGIPAAENAPDLWERVRERPVAEPGTPLFFAADSADRIIHWSEGLEDFLGWSARERLGRPLVEIEARVPGLPVDLAELAHEPGEETHLSLLLEFVRRDGTRTAAETTLSWIRDSSARRIGTVFVLEALAQSQAD